MNKANIIEKTEEKTEGKKFKHIFKLNEKEIKKIIDKANYKPITHNDDKSHITTIYKQK